MSEIPVPTRDEVVALLKAVLDGTTSRTAAAEWASEVQENIEDQEDSAESRSRLISCSCIAGASWL